MDDIKWVDLPPSSVAQHRMGSRKKFVNALRARPGEWAQYQPGHPHSSAVTSAFKRDFPGVEATARHRSDGAWDVYARWVGNGNGEAP